MKIDNRLNFGCSFFAVRVAVWSDWINTEKFKRLQNYWKFKVSFVRRWTLFSLYLLYVVILERLHWRKCRELRHYTVRTSQGHRLLISCSCDSLITSTGRYYCSTHPLRRPIERLIVDYNNLLRLWLLFTQSLFLVRYSPFHCGSFSTVVEHATTL
jgi:hypothetical protein